jgi:hypothetical protein
MEHSEVIQLVAISGSMSCCVWMSRPQTQLQTPSQGSFYRTVGLWGTFIAPFASASECRHGAALSGSRGNHWRVCWALSTVWWFPRWVWWTRIHTDGVSAWPLSPCTALCRTVLNTLLTDTRIWTVNRSRCAVEQWPVCSWRCALWGVSVPTLHTVSCWGGGSVQTYCHCTSYQSGYRPAVMQHRRWPKPWHSWQKWPSVNRIRRCQVLCCYHVSRPGLLNEHWLSQSVRMQRHKLGAMPTLHADF